MYSHCNFGGTRWPATAASRSGKSGGSKPTNPGQGETVRITEKHYAPWVKARQEQLEADVRHTWDTLERKRRVPAESTPCNSFEIKAKNGAEGGIGIQTPLIPRNLFILLKAKNAKFA